MNQILLTKQMASKCQKRNEKRHMKREARKIRKENFKLIIKNAVKYIFSQKNIEPKACKKIKEIKEVKKVSFKPMNQILISGEKALMPIKHRENMIYKAGLVFSIICTLTFGGLSAYATYDRNKNEEISREILANIETKIPEKEVVENKVTSERISISDDCIVVILNKEVEEPKINIEQLANSEKEENNEKKYIEVNLTENGETYYVIATISIPKINVNYPVLSETSDELLKISPCKYWGGEVNEVGNLCIMGHNYVNSKFFSKVPNLTTGDIIEITDILTEETVKYSVYDKYQIADDDMSCTSQMTDGNIDITLITCTNNGKGRIVVKARATE